MDQLEEDEDVVFQESALYNYFEEIGIKDSEFEYAIRSKESNVDIAANKNYFYSLINYTKLKFRRGVCWFTSILTENHLNELETQALQEYLKLILQREHIIEEDAHYLNNWIKSNDSELCLKQNYRRRSLNGLNVSLFVIMAAVINQSCCSFPIMKSLLWASFSIYGIVLSSLFIKEVTAHYTLHRFQKQHKANLKFLNIFLDSCQQVNSFMNKSLNFIQELEVVARGFTLFLPSTPISKLERITSSLHSSYQQCPGLRLIISQYAEENFLNFREATKYLFLNYHLCDGIDHSSHYLATVPLEEFSSVFNSKDVDDDDAILPIGLIKSSWSLSRLQMSEYFRRLGLIFIPELQDTKNGSVIRNLISVLSPIHYQVISIKKNIEQSYNFHKSTALNMSSSAMEKPHYLATTNHFNSLQIAVHSLGLHLQSSLNRVITMETILENIDFHLKMNNSPKNGIKDDLYQSLFNNLQSIKMEVDACVSCYDESIQRLDFTFGIKTQENEISSLFKSNNTTMEKGLQNISTHPISIIGLEDPVAEDQVFEAIVTDEDNTVACCQEDSDFLVLEKNKYNRENSKRMLKELKSVLIVKADEWKKREEVALAKLKIFQDIKGIKENGDTEEVETSVISEHSSNSTEIISGNEEPPENIQKTPEKDVNNELFSTLSSDELSLQENIITDSKEKIEDSLKQFSQTSSLGFLANVAAMAASRSQFYNVRKAEMFVDESEEFGDDDSDEN